MSKAIDHFKLGDYAPRETQVVVINGIEKAFQKKRIVILEAPVGSGKSAIALAIARWAGKSHILTPRKSLQDQYYDDFKKEVALVKGKSGYPCLPRIQPLVPAKKIDTSTGKVVFIPTTPDIDIHKDDYKVVTNLIHKRIPVSMVGDVNCSEGPCVTSTARKKNCENDENRPCPYNLAIDVANSTDHIVHNVHSFFFQNMYGARFEERDLIVIDEAHDLEGILRDFLRAKVSIPFHELGEIPEPSASDPIDEWVNWFLLSKGLSFSILEGLHPQQEFAKQLENYFSSRDAWVREEETPDGGTKIVDTPEKRFSTSLIKLMDIYSEHEGDPPVISTFRNDEKSRMEYTVTPTSLGNNAHRMILNMGKKVLLMSGTFYGKNTVCKNLGINPDDAVYLSIPSEFPTGNRPIFFKSDLAADNSYAGWRDEPENVNKMVRSIKRIMEVYHDKKGIIHAPSYTVARMMESLINDDRIVSHNPNNFVSVLNRFYEDDTSNDVLISPTCQQGVDFKNDRARFQIILRVPYMSTEDEFVKYMMKKNFSWYNYHSLIVFGQMIGRVVRGPKDWGHTYLLDSRFKKYIHRNAALLPSWLKKAIQFD